MQPDAEASSTGSITYRLHGFSALPRQKVFPLVMSPDIPL
jgi:hypothetical protein